MSDNVSVVIPLYNKKASIGKTLNSVLNQTVSPLEIIVVDDGSTDGSSDVVKEIRDPRIRLIWQENQRQAAARNHGIALARGELIAFLDADDIWRHEYLQTIMELRSLYPQAGIYGTAYDLINPNGTRENLEFKVLPNGATHGLIENIFKVGVPQPIHTSATVVPKYILEKLGGYTVGRRMEDIDLFIRIAIRYPVAWNKNILSTYCMDADNRLWGVKRYDHEPAYVITVRDVLKSGVISEDKENDLREYAAFWHYYVIRHLLLTNKKELARRMISETKGTSYYSRYGKLYMLLSYFPIPLLLGIRAIVRFYFSIRSLSV